MDRCSLFLGPPTGALERGSLVMDYYGYVRWYNLALKGPVSSRRLHSLIFQDDAGDLVCVSPALTREGQGVGRVQRSQFTQGPKLHQPKVEDDREERQV
ncbi:hypothetical protein AnigIFM50267_004887 [Aspergillus niger]|nr:hypothetical protein AnigIFM50267_004887 [Aspergillus niger]